MNPARKTDVKAFWEAEACGERYGTEQDQLRYELEPEILAFADFETGNSKRVLEIGVGMGADFLRWVGAGAQATGVDLTERAVMLTSRRLAEADLVAGVTVADAEELPFRDDEFDIVYSWGVLHHSPNPARALSEAERVLAPGGQLKLMLYHRHSWVALAAWARFGVLRGRPFTSLRGAVANIESSGTQAFAAGEVRRMLPRIENMSVTPSLTTWDRKWAPFISSALGDRFGWFLLIEGIKRADPSAS